MSIKNKYLYCVEDRNGVQYLCPSKPKLVLCSAIFKSDTYRWEVLKDGRWISVNLFDSGCIVVPEGDGLDKDCFWYNQNKRDKRAYRVCLSLV
jgi:hypothetical protein